LYAYISGIVDELLPDRAVLEAGGVGYELFCSALTLKRLKPGQKERLYTHLHLAEGVMALYGFYEPEEKDMFRRLLTVTRVGPKLALSVLSVLTPSDVAGAIVTNNAAAFDRVSGMGRKTAQRVLLELKERVGTSEMLAGNANTDAPDIRSEAVRPSFRWATTGSPRARRSRRWSRRRVWKRSSRQRFAKWRNSETTKIKPTRAT